MPATATWRTNDAFSFRYNKILGDFDLKVRVRGWTLPPWTGAGLMDARRRNE